MNSNVSNQRSNVYLFNIKIHEKFIKVNRKRNIFNHIYIFNRQSVKRIGTRFISQKLTGTRLVCKNGLSRYYNFNFPGLNPFLKVFFGRTHGSYGTTVI